MRRRSRAPTVDALPPFTWSRSWAPQSFTKQSVPPALTRPVGGAVVSTPSTVFAWEPVFGAERHRIQVSQSPTFAGTPLTNALTDSTSFTSNTTYPADTARYWRVRAEDGPAQVVALSRSATGGELPHRAVNPTPGPYSLPGGYNHTLPEPNNLAEEVGAGRLLFSWNPRPRAHQYRVQVSNRADFATTIETTTKTSRAQRRTSRAPASRSSPSEPARPARSPSRSGRRAIRAR